MVVENLFLAISEKNRQQLADFLSVDRSAMSNELCKMRADGLITFEKNRFELLTEHRETY